MRHRYFAVEGPDARELDVAPGPAHDVLDAAGAAVYEGVRTFDGSCFFALQEHLTRLEASRVAVGAPAFEPDDIHRALVSAGARFVQDAGVEARVRIDLCRGPAGALGTASHVVLTLTPFPGVARQHLERGVWMRTTASIRRELPHVKDSPWTVLRARHIAAHPELAECYEPALVDDDGRILEGVQSNLVLVRRGKPWTAPMRVLQGVTRDAVLELCPEEVVRDFVLLPQLPEVSEAFLTSSVRGVVPVTRIDDVVLGDGRPGRLTRELMVRYDSHAHRAAR